MVTQGQNVELVAQIGGAAAAVAVQGRHVYLAVGTRVLVLDASDPAQPVVVGQSAPLPDVVRRIVAQDRYAYLAAGRAGLRVFDIGEPSAPRELAAVATARPAISIALYRNHAYVTEAGGGIRIFDLRDPRQPSEAGFYDASPSYVPPQIVGDHAYVGAG